MKRRWGRTIRNPGELIPALRERLAEPFNVGPILPDLPPF